MILACLTMISRWSLENKGFFFLPPCWTLHSLVTIIYLSATCCCCYSVLSTDIGNCVPARNGQRFYRFGLNHDCRSHTACNIFFNSMEKAWPIWITNSSFVPKKQHWTSSACLIVFNRPVLHLQCARLLRIAALISPRPINSPRPLSQQVTIATSKKWPRDGSRFTRKATFQIQEKTLL